MNNHKKHEMMPAMGSMTGNDAGDGNASLLILLVLFLLENRGLVPEGGFGSRGPKVRHPLEGT